MTHPDDSLPQNVRDALRGGNSMEAIRRLRRATGIGLAEAKRRIDAHVQQNARGGSTRTSLSNAALESAAAAIQRGSFLEAIRLVRTGMDPGPKKTGKARQALDRAQPIYVPSPDTPPDTFHRIVTALWWVLALAIAGLVAFYFLGSG